VRAGIKESGHTHCHTFAGNLLENRANMRDIQVALDHSLISTTQVYLAFTAVGDLRALMEGNRKEARDAPEGSEKGLRFSGPDCQPPFARTVAQHLSDLIPASGALPTFSACSPVVGSPSRRREHGDDQLRTVGRG
jgi:hypothetical protein